jgi:hypothetical protein
MLGEVRDEPELLVGLHLVGPDGPNRRFLDLSARGAGADGSLLVAGASVVVVVATAAGVSAERGEHRVAVLVAAAVAVSGSAVNFGMAGCANEKH